MSIDARNKVVELIEQKYKKLIEYIAKDIIADAFLVEDIYQEVVLNFISLHEDKFDLPPDEMKNYLCAAVRNTALTMLKKKQKTAVAEQDEIDCRQLNMDKLNLEAFHHAPICRRTA